MTLAPLVCVSLSPAGDLVFPVHPVQQAIRVRGHCGSLCGGQQRHPAPEADAEAGRGPVLHRLPRQQARQPVDLHCISTERTVLPHLVHCPQLLLAEARRILPGRHDDHEHHDVDLFLPAAPRRSVPREEELGAAQRDAQLQKVSQRLRRIWRI